MARRQLFRSAVAAFAITTFAPAAFAQTSSHVTLRQAEPQTLTQTQPEAIAEEGRRQRPGWLVPMHVVSATMQGLDLHSTYASLEQRGVEMNPLLQGVSRNKVAYAAVKVGVAATLIYATEKMARRRPVTAFVTSLAVNSVYLMIVAHNYSVARRSAAILAAQ